MIGLLARKVGMAQIYTETGKVIPVTVVKAGPCYVVQKKDHKTDGYYALQIGFETKPKTNKPYAGHFKKRNLEPMRVLNEFRFKDATSIEEFAVGQEIKPDVFSEGEKISVTGYTKGRGFTGGMKRWGWHGGPATHGSMSHRRIGSVGSGTSPGRPLKGRTLPGHYGMEKVTIKNLRIVKIEPEKYLLYIKGAVPGSNYTSLVIRKQQ
ncbi:MAG: 50S ribosomal protein L3 [Candidatus Latescibacteria bacterium]|nr:50S ribosomal protein L3 [Candidatus Latescibacterota bacterium]